MFLQPTTTIIKACPNYVGRLHELCFYIPINLKPNPQISYTSPYLFLLPSLTSSLAHPFLLVGHPSWPNFSLPAYFSLILSPIVVTPKCSQKRSNSIILDWPTLCSIGHSWSNRCPVKFSLQSCWHSLGTKHSKRRSHFNHPALILSSTSSSISLSLLIIEPR